MDESVFYIDGLLKKITPAPFPPWDREQASMVLSVPWRQPLTITDLKHKEVAVNADRREIPDADLVYLHGWQSLNAQNEAQAYEICGYTFHGQGILAAQRPDKKVIGKLPMALSAKTELLRLANPEKASRLVKFAPKQKAVTESTGMNINVKMADNFMRLICDTVDKQYSGRLNSGLLRIVAKDMYGNTYSVKNFRAYQFNEIRRHVFDTFDTYGNSYFDWCLRSEVQTPGINHSETRVLGQLTTPVESADKADFTLKTPDGEIHFKIHVPMLPVKKDFKPTWYPIAGVPIFYDDNRDHILVTWKKVKK